MYKVRNWDKWQTYRSDRSQPPWIKIHRQIMRNPEWVGLSDAQRGQLVAIWLLAADHNGEIPECAKLVQKLCHMESEPAFLSFANQGFIEHDANMTPTWRQTDANMTQQTRLDQTRLDQTRPDARTALALSRLAEFWDEYQKKKLQDKARRYYSKAREQKKKRKKKKKKVAVDRVKISWN